MARQLTKAELHKLEKMFATGRSSGASVLVSSEPGAGTPERQAGQESLFDG